MDNTNGAPDAATTADSARRIKDSAAQLLETGKDAAKQKAEQGAESMAQSAQNTASALRRAADNVQPDSAWVGNVLRKSADSLDSATRSLADGDLSRGVSDVNAFARRNPALFLGASVALGFALARVGKTAIERSTNDDSNEQYNPYSNTTPGM